MSVSNRIARIVIILAGLVWFGQARAEDGSVFYVTCAEGGCECHLTDLPFSDAEFLMDEAAPTGATEPYLYDDGSGPSWGAAITPDELDLTWGGDGSCEIFLFPAIIPEDGLWLGTAHERSVADCPRGLSAALDPALAGILERRRMEWGGIFHPGQIASSQTPIQWTKITDDLYSGMMPLNSGGPITISAVWESEIKNPRYVRSVVRIRIRSSAAGTASFGLANCRISAVVDFNRIGD